MVSTVALLLTAEELRALIRSAVDEALRAAVPVAPSPAPANDLPMLTVAEAAHSLGLCTRTLRRHIRSGALPASRIGDRALRIHRDDLEAFRGRSRRAPFSESSSADLDARAAKILPLRKPGGRG